jgi:hypothetical protein
LEGDFSENKLLSGAFLSRNSKRRGRRAGRGILVDPLAPFFDLSDALEEALLGILLK